MRDDEVIGGDGSDELGLGGPGGGGGGGIHAETVTNVTEQEVLSSTSSATKQSGTVSVKTGSTRHTMGTKRKSRNGGGHGGKHSVGQESVSLRVENVVDWDVVMNMYKDMQHMDDDALEDSRHQSDHKNYDLGGSFSATKAIDSSFGFTT
ncbi:uncharacterized protein LOC142354349 [Convolutriloba macropyga]|uniref:uncharacterized protein LOC142354349 n=1 Tax=Convolutriloba macropyga TaxID=536237 RepID=UPI003F51BAFD